MKNFLNLFLLLSSLLCTSCSSFDFEPTNVNIATFNMRCDDDPSRNWSGSWSLRKVIIAQAMGEYDMDIVASQELYAHQLIELKGQLRGQYDYVETQFLSSFDKSIIAGRTRPKADDIEIKMHNAIWYKVSKYIVLEKGSFYLSATPDKMSFGFEKNAQCRRCVWAKFKDVKTGGEFYVFNVHGDWENRLSRLNSAELVMQKIAKICGKFPVYLLGDFNDETVESAEIFTRGNVLMDSRLISKSSPQGSFSTYHNWGVKDANSAADRLDYIFVSKNIAVESYKVLNENIGDIYSSDHYCVITQTSF